MIRGRPRRCRCRACACTSILARDNDASLCSRCRQHDPGRAAPTQPDDFWTDPDLQAARAARDMGAVCRAYRLHPVNRRAEGRPIPQELVAAWIGLSQVQICRIERGTNRVRDLDKLIRWARALRMPSSFAWFELPPQTDQIDRSCNVAADPSVEEAEDDDVKRRTLVVSLAAAAAGVGAAWPPPAPSTQPANRTVPPPAPLSSAVVDRLQRDTTHFFHREELLPARQLAPGLRTHIETLNHLLAGSPPDDLRGRLLSAIGEALALYGWFAFDRNDLTAARRFYDLATNAARDARDDALAACVLGYRSYLAEAMGALGPARDMLAVAQESVRSPSSATTRAWLAAREAEVRASLLESTDALRALDRATTAYDYARPHHERSWTAFFTASRLGSMAVTTYTRLDHPRLGSTADAVLTALGPDDAKIRAVILADLATAAIHRESYDTGASLAIDALAATTSQEASLGADRLRRLRRLIQPRLRVPVLRDLDTRLGAL